MSRSLSCHYCQGKTELVTGEDIYPHRPDLYSKLFYRCTPCDAYVGCHPGTDKPLGRVANAELRAAKSAAHREFDEIWKTKMIPTRRKAYQWLAKEMMINENKCHIGMFTVEMCNKAIHLSRKFKLANQTRL